MKPCLFLASLLAASALVYSEAYATPDDDARAALCLAASMQPPPVPVKLEASRLQWRLYSDGDPRYVMLWDVGTDAMVGAYTFATGCYEPCGPDGHLMGGTCTRPPLPPPVSPQAVLPTTGPVALPSFPAATRYVPGPFQFRGVACPPGRS